MKNSKGNTLNAFIKIIENLSEHKAASDILDAVFKAFKNILSLESEKSDELFKPIQPFEFSLDEFTQAQDILTPEILGVIYEITHSQRKIKGVFYTPKQIVLYMCRESLSNYLRKVINVESDIITDLEHTKISSDQAYIIDKALSDVKVCDPAIGCGAFTVGILYEISRLRHILTPYINPARTLYELKKHAIENSIFGADIDGGAIDIVKKRLWLSLLNENGLVEDYKSIKFNILQGNSLTGEINFLNIPDYFNIVLANPPYVGEKGNKDIFRKVKDGPLGHYFQGKMDLFYFFFHLALNITKENGEISFITTNYFPTATGSQKLRKDLKERAIIRKIVNFNEMRLFDSALGQHNMITFLQKACNQKAKVHIISTYKKGFVDIEVLRNIVEFRDTETNYLELKQEDLYEGEGNYIRLYKSNVGSMLEGILEKMQQNSVPLGEICYIHQGLKTNADKVTQKHIENYPELLERKVNKDEGIFIIKKDHPVLKRLLEGEKRFIKPLFKNSDIQSYFTNTNFNNCLLFITKENFISEDDINIKEHLEKFRPIIQNRAEIEPEGRIPLYAITRPRKGYMYSGPKIVAPYKSKDNNFGYNECEWYASGDVYYINQKNDNFELKYILALLNSKLYLLWFKIKGKRKGRLLELYQKPLSEVPIIIQDIQVQTNLVKLVDQMLLSGKYNIIIQEEIDNYIFNLFNLNEEEINELLCTLKKNV